jgi:alpha-galactosidase
MLCCSFKMSGPMLVLLALVACACATAAEQAAPPPNGPAEVRWDAQRGTLHLQYHGAAILEAAVSVQDAAGQEVKNVALTFEPAVIRDDKERVEQRLKWTLTEPKEGATLVLRGAAVGSEETFPAETAGEAQKRFPLVRNSVGLSHNLRNNALYDRRWDWVLIGQGDRTTRIQPKALAKSRIEFTWETRGAAVELVFRPRYYQKHRGLAYFEPWTYRVWKGSVTGYCTWWAYRDHFSQKTLDELVDVFAEKKLPDFGYKYVQIDDAYQIGNGSCPQNWLTWNGKFPGGAEYAIHKIKSAGMQGGIWVHRVHRPTDPHVADIGQQHPDWFVHKPNGDLFRDAGFYILNTKNQAALDGLVRPIYRELRKQGWDYVKIDGAGDLLSCYKNQQCAEHFQKIGSTPEESLRDWDRVAREELGPDVYILNCWGVGPGLSVVGLADGCRLSSDGFQPETLANHISYEGVVWRNDPDHCDILGSWLMDENNGMQVFAIRESRPHPWILSTTRHLSQGGVSLLDERWDATAKTLSGTSAVVAGDPYVLTIHLPQGYRLKNVQFGGAKAEIANRAETATVRIVPSATRSVEWKMDFAGA